MTRRFIFFILLNVSLGYSFGQDWKSKLNQARSFYQKGDFVQSLKAYEEAKILAPESIDFSSEIGQAAYKANDFTKAKSYYESAVSKKDKKNIGSNEYHNLGNSQMKMKDYASAISSYREALKKNPNDLETRYNLSEAIRKNKRENKESKNENSDKENQPPNQPQNQPQKDKNQPADIPKRTVDRILDKLSKKEAETKRKINNETNKKGDKTKPEKDW